MVYLATAEVRDEEMAERIIRHQQQRPPEWLTVEAPLDITGPLLKYQSGYTVLLDCLTMYLSNLYFHYESTCHAQELDGIILEKFNELVQVILNSKANIIIVTNEVGWGIVPENFIARKFRDLSGTVNQYIAGVCNEVYLLVCGIPMKIKGGLEA